MINPKKTKSVRDCIIVVLTFILITFICSIESAVVSYCYEDYYLAGEMFGLCSVILCVVIITLSSIFVSGKNKEGLVVGILVG